MSMADGTFQFTFTQTHKNGEGRIDSLSEWGLRHDPDGRVELVVRRSNTIGITTETWCGDTQEMLRCLHAALPHAIVPADFRTLLLSGVDMIIQEDGHESGNLAKQPHGVHIPNFLCDQIQYMLQACV